MLRRRQRGHAPGGSRRRHRRNNRCGYRCFVHLSDGDVVPGRFGCDALVLDLHPRCDLGAHGLGGLGRRRLLGLLRESHDLGQWPRLTDIRRRAPLAKCGDGFVGRAKRGRPHPSTWILRIGSRHDDHALAGTQALPIHGIQLRMTHDDARRARLTREDLDHAVRQRDRARRGGDPCRRLRLREDHELRFRARRCPRGHG